MTSPQFAWMIIEPHPERLRLRRMVRRIGGRLVTVFRLPVRRVEIIETREPSRTARVRYRVRTRCKNVVGKIVVRSSRDFIVTTWTTFDRLASTREKFRERFLAIATVTAADLRDAARSRRGGVKQAMPADTPGRVSLP